MKKLSGIIILIFFTVGIFCLAVNKFLLSNTFGFFLVSSGSMEPALKVGSLLLTIKTEHISVEDILVFSHPKTREITSHRVVDIVESSYITKGDSNLESDKDLVLKESIIGKVLVSFPYLGYLMYMLRTLPGLLLLVYLPFFLLIWRN